MCSGHFCPEDVLCKIESFQAWRFGGPRSIHVVQSIEVVLCSTESVSCVMQLMQRTVADDLWTITHVLYIKEHAPCSIMGYITWSMRRTTCALDTFAHNIFSVSKKRCRHGGSEKALQYSNQQSFYNYGTALWTIQCLVDETTKVP